MSAISIAVSRLHAAVAAVCPIVSVRVLDPVAHLVELQFAPAATGPQQAAANAVVAAFDWSNAAQLVSEAQAAKAAATAGIDTGALQAGDKLERIVRALALVMLDEINILRAIANPVQPPRTAAQVVAAIKAKIAATAE